MNVSIQKPRAFSRDWVKKEVKEVSLLFAALPAIPTLIFVLSVVLMNVMAPILVVNHPVVALDGGLIVSWVSFLGIDMIVKRFGPKAATTTMCLALFVNLCVYGILSALGGLTFLTGQISPVSLWLRDLATGTGWWVLGASTFAFLVSAIISNILHWIIRKKFSRSSRNKLGPFMVASWVSATTAQIIDNLLFGFLFGYLFFNRVLGIPITPGAIFGAVAVLTALEIVCHAIFTPLGHRLSENWRKEGRGKEYLAAVGLDDYGDAVIPAATIK